MEDICESLIECAKSISYSFSQKWGDCYKVNATVKEWLNQQIGRNRFRLYQVKVQISEEIFDNEDVGYTDCPDHVLVVDTDKAGDKDGEYYSFLPNKDSSWHDFSNVFVDEREAKILGVTFYDELNGQTISKLYKKLNKIKLNKLYHYEANKSFS